MLIQQPRVRGWQIKHTRRPSPVQRCRNRGSRTRHRLHSVDLGHLHHL